VLQRFILTLLSSWAVNPLWVIVAHAMGFSQNKTLAIILLGSGACVPFQLLLNECLAVGNAQGRFKATNTQIAGILLGQAVVCVFTLLNIDYSASQPLWPLIALAGMFSIGNFLSYSVSLKYYRLVINSALNTRLSMIVGGIPGITSLIAYTAYFSIRHDDPLSPNTALIALIPASSICQWLFIRNVENQAYCDGRLTRNSQDIDIKSIPSVRALFFSMTALVALTAAGTNLRDSIASLNAANTALILVGLNSLTSLANTVTRAKFLSKPGQSRQHRLLALLGIATAISLALRGNKNPYAQIFTFITVQLGIIITIEFSRKIKPVIIKHIKFTE
jgi:hypothetical protein